MSSNRDAGQAGSWSRTLPVIGWALCSGVANAQILVEPVPQFADPRVYTGVQIHPYGMATANFDGDIDGYPDVAVAVRGGLTGGAFGRLAIFRNRGVDESTGEWLGFFTPPDMIELDALIETEAFALAAGNLDSDALGLPDLVVSATASDEVFVYLNTPQGFLPPDRYSLPDFFAPRGVAVGRFGSSQHLDIAVASGNGDEVIFLQNVNGQGDAYFAHAPETLGTGVAAWTVVHGEFDNSLQNNLQDAVTPDFVGTAPCHQPFVNDTISALRNDGGYEFTATQNAGGCGDYPRNYIAIAKGRFLGGGEADDIAASEYCRAYVDVIFGDGVGGWSHNCSLDRYQVHPDANIAIEGIATGHLNGGTKTDIVVSLKDSHEVAILLGKGNGTFQRPTTNSGYRFSVLKANDPNDLGEGPRQVMVVDLDLDGFGDIVTSNDGDPLQNFLNPSISVLINESFVSVPPP